MRLFYAEVLSLASAMPLVQCSLFLLVVNMSFNERSKRGRIAYIRENVGLAARHQFIVSNSWSLYRA